MKKIPFNTLAILISFIVFFSNGYTQVSRPPGNNGTGFFVNSGKIYDPSGVEFIPLGLNAAVYWDPGTADCKRNSMSNNLPQSGANALRIVSQTQGAFGWNANPTDQRDLVNRAVQGKMVPMLEMHDATCNANAFTTIVNYWKSAPMVQLCKDFERYMWVNIANEHDFATPEEWRDSYISAIQQLRTAGIKNLIVVDAGKNCGQNPTMIPQYGQAVINADPQHNVVFSVHMYQFWRTADRTFTGWVPPYRVEVDLPAIKNAGLPIIVGEFGWYSANENYAAQTLINVCRQNNIGWYFWSEFDQASKPFYSIIANICGDLSSGNRTPAGNFLIPYMQTNAVKAPVFGGGGGGTITLQAENYTTQSGGANGTAQGGYTGTGYYDMGGNGTWVEYVFNVTNAGNYNVSIRYANGGTTNRACNVITNGAAVANNFVPTGAWTTWVETAAVKSLTAGSNRIRIHATTANGGPNVDRLVISPVSSARTVVEELQELNNAPVLYPNPASSIVKIAGINSRAHIRIFSMASGQLVKSVFTSNGAIDVSDLAKGAYLLRVKEESIKLIKE